MLTLNFILQIGRETIKSRELIPEIYSFTFVVIAFVVFRSYALQ